MSENLALEVRNITKRFPGVIANDQVNFKLRKGEIHALLGENGAGKSTLMNVIYGLYSPDEGEFFLDGQPAEINNPHDAIHEIGYGWNGCGVAVDIRFITDEMIESIQAVESYPLLSEDDHSQLEWEAVSNHWEAESISDRVDELQRHGLSVFAARHDDTPWRDGFDAIRESITEYLNEYPTAAA